MNDIINNTSPIEAIVILAFFAVGLAYYRRKSPVWRRRYLFAYGLALILYTTLLRRIPFIWGDMAHSWSDSAHTDRLEFVGFNLSGCILNALLFVPLGLSLRGHDWWLPLLLSVAIEVVQRVTHLGMFDAWDILANAIGGLAGISVSKLLNTD